MAPHWSHSGSIYLMGNHLVTVLCLVQFLQICIQDHCKYKLFGIIDMNCDLILSIDWLQQHNHNPSIDWESHQISFSCCNGNNHATGISGSLDNSIHVTVLSADDSFTQDQISGFGIINFIPDSIVLAASITNPTSENPIPVPGTLDYIKSKVPEKYSIMASLMSLLTRRLVPCHPIMIRISNLR